jgi:hypothetical protein
VSFERIGCGFHPSRRPVIPLQSSCLPKSKPGVEIFEG